MLNCKDATKLMSDALDRTVGWRERIGLRMHLLFCGACRNAGRQMVFIRRAFRVFAKTGMSGKAGHRKGPE